MSETTSVIPNFHRNSARSEVSEDRITWTGHTASKQQKQLKLKQKKKKRKKIIVKKMERNSVMKITQDYRWTSHTDY